MVRFDIMPGIDLFFADSLASTIKKKLDSKTEKKLKTKLFEKYGFSIKQTVENYPKLNKILKEFLESKTSNFEKKCIQQIFSIKKSKNDRYIITIKDQNLTNSFLQLLGENESRKILNSTLNKSLLISEILSVCKLPNTSGYRKINSLIRKGFLIKTGIALTRKRRALDRYTLFCDKINIDSKQNKFVTKVWVSNSVLQESSILPILGL